ncbi:LOW QUALITY PROTEIN: DNA mismatch repair protein Msh6-like [Paramacrobiotus metropolitanus]|uniref:LOW QUALITY PROTEIN: DNA mismatch repair protein Msh6-like n=1 Tax=Paramacrobiotus metropolitanus TaxID=2943436 RepID=UPI002445EE42|nr:LOW QUALITY PROTEIN: DNA mismatch repair protein Msh6-like [Paramacrobiotus metropolitanus]
MPRAQPTPSTPSSGSKTQSKLTSFFTKTPETTSRKKSDVQVSLTKSAATVSTESPAHRTAPVPRSPLQLPSTNRSFTANVDAKEDRDVEDDSDGEPTTSRRARTKTARPVIDDSESEVENAVEKDPDFSADDFDLQSESSASEGEPEEQAVTESENEDALGEANAFKTPKKRKKNDSKKDVKRQAVQSSRGKVVSRSKQTTAISAKAANGKTKKQKNDSAMDIDETANSEDNGDDVQDDGEGEIVTKHTHESLSWLQPNVAKDKEGKLHRDLLENGIVPRTLSIPPNFLAKDCTPGLRHWWEIKSDNFDCVLFFKMGKFYEMWHMDADVGVNELQLTYMRGDHAHCGFPERSMPRYLNLAVSKGYKVVRVEQMMTAQQLKETKNKQMPREVVRILTPGTQSVNTLDCESEKQGTNASCLLVIAEKVRADSSGSQEHEYGICVVYPGPGNFWVGQFQDDRYHSRLRTLLAIHSPTEIILERNNVSPALMELLRTNTETVCREYLAPNKEFLSVKEAVKFLLEREYFGPVMNPSWPEVIRSMLDLEGSSLPTPKASYDLAIRSLGSCAWYLHRCKIDYDIISLKNFELYAPADGSSANVVKKNKQKQMILDGMTLINLDIVPGPRSDPSSCLLRKIDKCKTRFGRRLLKEWLVAPLFRVEEIEDRQKAMEEIATFRQDHNNIYASVKKMLQELPDLERLLSKIHIVGSLKRHKEHPETRAVMFDDTHYGINKIKDLIAAIKGFDSVMNISRQLSKCFTNARSLVLRQVIGCCTDSIFPEGQIPDLTKVLRHFDKAFDKTEAAKAGKIVPLPGVDTQFDDALKEELAIADQLEIHRMDVSKKLKCRTAYFHQARNRFQLEVPEDVKVPGNFERKSGKKGFIRYWTDEIKELLPSLVSAEERREEAEKDCTRRVFEKFDLHYADWMCAVKCTGKLDILFSLEEYSSNLLPNSCMPKFREAVAEQQSFIAVRDGRHPLVMTTFSKGEFIPNDTYIGTGEPDQPSRTGTVVLVTGPNMGGKSTLMRQVGIIAVLAQLGSRVPATFCELTPVDRIFTRIGASDNLLAGESTFFVELSETSSILQHATTNSLVLIDELGRGTATFDGTAIAAAVLKALATRVKCRTLFSTHYHSLVDRFGSCPDVKLGHMACLVENEDENNPTKETVTLLYKFMAGDCPKSYGFNAARLAGIPDEIVTRARIKAVEMEKIMQIGKVKLDA